MIRIFADFNAREGDRLPLDFEGSFSDIRKQKVELQDGLRIIVYDDQVEAEAVVQNVKGEWYARIIDGTLRIHRWE
ncbi:hypothetical protein J2P12_07865 [Candidatus Bathyarchaeota archaeon]|nr:hypothetical protein [Candidatus Bathyarchaeota archaeon]